MNRFSQFSSRRGSGGYALATTVVFVALAVTIAVGLSLSRQMWGQMGEKQLHRILTQTAMDVDATAMMAALRTGMPAGASVNVSENMSGLTGGRTTLTITPYVGAQPVVYQTGVTVGLPVGNTNGSFPLEANLFYDQLVGVSEPSVLGSWDPLRGIWGVNSGFGIMVQNELLGGMRTNKSVQTQRDEQGVWKGGSRLFSWNEVDTAKVYEVAVRRFPASVFTLYVPSIPGVSESGNLGFWAAGGSSSQPIGRYYSEVPMAPGRADVVLDTPFILAGGLNWNDTAWAENGANWKFRVPASAMGATQPRTGTRQTETLGGDAHSDYTMGRNITYGGMLAEGKDRPVYLGRFGGTNASLSGALFPSFSGMEFNFPVSSANKDLMAHLWESSVRVVRLSTNTAVSVSGYGTTWPLGASLVTVNDTNREIILNFNAITNIGTNSLVLSVSADGYDTNGSTMISNTERAEYRVRVICPNVDSLGWTGSSDGKRGLTIVTPHPLILSGGFNASGSEVPSMLVSPYMVVEGTPGVPVSVNSVVVTTGSVMTNNNPLSDVFQGVPGSSPSQVNLVGSLLFWKRFASPGRTLVSGYPLVPVSLYPSPTCYTGEAYPPGIPAFMDVRYGRERLRNYRIYSEETTFVSSGDE
jgi:hypothetical protein